MMKTNELDRQVEEAAKLAAEIQETGWGRPFASALEGAAAIVEALYCADGWDEAAMRHEEAMWEAVKQGCTATAVALCGKFMRDKEGWE